MEDNSALTTLHGLEELSTIGSDLTIRFNGLESCSCGLAGLIAGDPPMFAGVQGDIIIGYNAPGGTCKSPEVVLATPCEPVANEEESAVPLELRLDSYPNPTAGPLIVRYALPQAGPVRLSICDLLGREVAIFTDAVQPVGEYGARFGGLATGVYVVRIEAGEEVRTRRVTVLR